MFVSDRGIFSPSRLLRSMLVGGKLRTRLLFKKLFKKWFDAHAAPWEFLDEAAYLDINNARKAWTRPTYKYDGDLLQNLEGTSPDESRHWAALPPHNKIITNNNGELTSGWQRMCSISFSRCWSPMLEAKQHVDKRYRSTTKRHKVLMTIIYSYLAFIPSLQEIGAR